MTRDEVLNMPAGYEINKLVQSFVMGGLPPVSDDIMPEFIKPFSSDISAAWQVVEKLNSNPKNVCVDVWHDESGWYCSVHFIGDTEADKADTAPLAICRAALLAVMGK